MPNRLGVLRRRPSYFLLLLEETHLPNADAAFPPYFATNAVRPAARSALQAFGLHRRGFLLLIRGFRLRRDALAIGIPVVLVLAVELRERLAVVRCAEESVSSELLLDWLMGMRLAVGVVDPPAAKKPRLPLVKFP
jgi:hypothetical protein